jgi:hypothetical protein
VDLFDGDILRLEEEAIEEADDTQLGNLKASIEEGDRTEGETATGTRALSASTVLVYPMRPSSLPSKTVAFEAILPRFAETGSGAVSAFTRGGVLRPFSSKPCNESSRGIALSVIKGVGRSKGLALGSDEEEGPGLVFGLAFGSLELDSIGYREKKMGKKMGKSERVSKM